MDAHARADRSLRDSRQRVDDRLAGKPGVSIVQARDELQAIMHNYLTGRGDERAARWGAALAPSARIPAPMAAPVGGFVGILGALTGLVLLIACSNVAGMLVARGLERRRELATRMAVGASRARLLRQLLLEGLTLAAIAGALSLPLTWWLVNLLGAWRPSLPVPLAIDLRVDLRVVAVAMLLSGLAALAFALLPALQSTRVDVSPVLRGAHASAGRRRAWLRAGSRGLPGWASRCCCW